MPVKPIINDKTVSMPSFTIKPALINTPPKAGIIHKNGIGTAEDIANRNKIILYTCCNFGETKKSKRFFVNFSINVKYLRDELSIFLIIFLLIRQLEMHFGINTLSLKKQICSVIKIEGIARIIEKPGKTGNGIMIKKKATNVKI